MIQKTIALTTSRQITLPSALIKLLGAEPGSKLIASYDEDKNAIFLEKKKSLEESLEYLRQKQVETLKENPAIAENIKRHAGWEFEEIRDEWDNTSEAKTYYQEKYGV